MIKDLSKWVFYFPLRVIIQPLPLRIIYFLGNVQGEIFYALAGNKKQLMKEELHRLLGNRLKEEEFYRVIKSSFRNYCKDNLEVLLYPKLNKEIICQMVRTEGLKYLDQSLSQGHGVILLLAHFGANQLVMPALGFRGYKINQIATPPAAWHEMHQIKPSYFLQKVFDLRQKWEAQFPAKLLYLGSSLRPAFECLQKNEILAIAFDGRGGSKWLERPFFDRIGRFSLGPFSLADKLQAPILPTFIIRQTNNQHKLIIEQPLPPVKNMTAYMDSFIRCLEKYIMKYPCHYTWLLLAARIRSSRDKDPLFAD